MALCVASVRLFRIEMNAQVSPPHLREASELNATRDVTVPLAEPQSPRDASPSPSVEAAKEEAVATEAERARFRMVQEMARIEDAALMKTKRGADFGGQKPVEIVEADLWKDLGSSELSKRRELDRAETAKNARLEKIMNGKAISMEEWTEEQRESMKARIEEMKQRAEAKMLRDEKYRKRREKPEGRKQPW